MHLDQGLNQVPVRHLVGLGLSPLPVDDLRCSRLKFYYLAAGMNAVNGRTKPRVGCGDDEELFAEPWAFRRSYQNAMQEFLRISKGKIEPYAMPESELKKLYEVSKPLRDEWVKKMNAAGRSDAAKILGRIQELIPLTAK